MAIKKELSKSCKNCGVEWLKDFSNKQPKRALCKECMKLEHEKFKVKYKHNQLSRGQNRHEKYRPFKIENRIKIYREVNAKIKPLKNRDEIREFVRIRFDEILKDIALWDYINDTDIENKNK